MKVHTPGGETVVVRRQWLPWRQHVRSDAAELGSMDFGGGDDLVSAIVIGLVLAILAPFIAVLLFAVGEFLLLLALLPLFIAARLGWAMTWTVLVTKDGEVLGTRKATGWTDSGVLIHDLAAAYERGEDPLAISP